MLSNKLRRLAIEAEGILISLPENSITEWFDGTYHDANIDMHFEEVDLARLLEFIVEVGVSEYSDPSKEISGKPNATKSFPELLDACTTLLSFTTDLLYRLNDQTDVDEIEPIRYAKEVMGKCQSIEVNPAPSRFEMTLQEQAAGFPATNIRLHLLAEGGQLWIRPEGYGEKCTEDGGGSPVGMEIWQGRLRVVVFDNINSEEARIIDMENARETARGDKTDHSQNKPYSKG
jgi:hypothetical protein